MEKLTETLVKKKLRFHVIAFTEFNWCIETQHGHLESVQVFKY